MRQNLLYVGVVYIRASRYWVNIAERGNPGCVGGLGVYTPSGMSGLPICYTRAYQACLSTAFGDVPVFSAGGGGYSTDFDTSRFCAG